MNINTVLLFLILVALVGGGAAVTGIFQTVFYAGIIIAVLCVIGYVICLFVLWILQGLSWVFNRRWLYWFVDIFVADPRPDAGYTKGQGMAKGVMGLSVAAATFYGLTLLMSP